MKNLLVFLVLVAFAIGAHAVETKRVCHQVKGKQVCKTIRIHKKIENAKLVPTEKPKPAKVSKKK